MWNSEFTGFLSDNNRQDSRVLQLIVEGSNFTSLAPGMNTWNSSVLYLMLTDGVEVGTCEFFS